MNDIYNKLAKHLSKTPGGFPATESGVEIRILKRLFTEKEAETALSLVMMPEPLSVIAERARKNISELEPILKVMVEKGLAIHSARNGNDYYMGAQFVIGIWEYQVNKLNKGLIKDFNEYVPFLVKEQVKTRTQQLRVVPVSQSINADMKIMAYEDAEEIIRAQSRILVAPCICRTEHNIMGKGCGRMVETCLVFGGGAYFYEERGIGRIITSDEAIEILHKGIEQGLVLQPGNSKKPLNICMCCSCCCQILKNIKKSDVPAALVNSSYFAEVNQDTCVACGACMEKCPMDAISMDDSAVVNTDRCIGCGVCTTACEFESISLKSKDQKDKWIPPENIIKTYQTIAMEKKAMVK